MSDAPLLSRRAADRARDAARRFSDAALVHRRPARLNLWVGDAGFALVHAGLEQAFPGRGHGAHAQRALSAATRALGRHGVGPSLASGFTGVAWAAELLCADDDAATTDDEDVVAAAIDAACESCTSPRSAGDYDLTRGLVGFAVHALERLPRAAARRTLARVVDALERLAIRAPEGLAWRSPAEASTVNLGLAHGVPGVVAVLGRVCASAAEASTRRKARRLLGGAVAWLLAQELPEDLGGGFPAAVGEGAVRVPSRCAWCHGDPGVAAALSVAATCAGEEDWARAARRIAVRAAERDDADCGVIDAGLCHGAAGLGHVYHRLYRATGEERLADASRRWLARAVELSDRDARFVWREYEGGRTFSRPGLMGGGGVALALLAATGDASADWDRALGISAREAA
jgi:lantibiotic modifying enzyme